MSESQAFVKSSKIHFFVSLIHTKISHTKRSQRHKFQPFSSLSTTLSPFLIPQSHPLSPFLLLKSVKFVKVVIRPYSVIVSVAASHTARLEFESPLRRSSPINKSYSTLVHCSFSPPSQSNLSPFQQLSNHLFIVSLTSSLPLFTILKSLQ